MSEHDDRLPMLQMLEHAREAVSHGYDTVDFDLLWDTIRDDFPPLIAALEDTLRATKG